MDHLHGSFVGRFGTLVNNTLCACGMKRRVRHPRINGNFKYMLAPLEIISQARSQFKLPKSSMPPLSKKREHNNCVIGDTNRDSVPTRNYLLLY